MSKLSSVLKKTGIAVAAAAMLVTMGAGTVVTQAKTSLPVYKVSLAKKYTNNQKGKQMPFHSIILFLTDRMVLRSPYILHMRSLRTVCLQLRILREILLRA